MSAMSHELDLAYATMLHPVDPDRHEIAGMSLMTEQWGAVHEAARAVANLAQLGREALAPEIAQIPTRAASKGGWHYETAARGIGDLAAVMQPGLRALLSLAAQGHDTTTAALTLWREFHYARDAIVELVAAG